MWKPQWRQCWRSMRQRMTVMSWLSLPGRSVVISLNLLNLYLIILWCCTSFCYFITNCIIYFLIIFPLGRGGESGVSSSGTSQGSVTKWHEETPKNFAHVFWSTVPWSDEGFWEGALLCSQGRYLYWHLFLYLFTEEIDNFVVDEISISAVGLGEEFNAYQRTQRIRILNVHFNSWNWAVVNIHLSHYIYFYISGMLEILGSK